LSLLNCWGWSSNKIMFFIHLVNTKSKTNLIGSTVEIFEKKTVVTYSSKKKCSFVSLFCWKNEIKLILLKKRQKSSKSQAFLLVKKLSCQAISLVYDWMSPFVLLTILSLDQITIVLCALNNSKTNTAEISSYGSMCP
jgi:hypothetical protein